ncbi:MAG TPA: AI-2E family transporter [Bryobacterales bacterium]|nr:AI-2E family transporter [Bryobacterales bacterium]
MQDQSGKPSSTAAQSARPQTRSRIGALLTAAAVVVVLAGMREAQDILLPFLIAVFLAVVSSPGVLWLTSRGVPHSLAVLLAVVAMVAAGTGIAALAGTSLNSFSRNLPAYQARLQGETSALLAWLEGMGVDVSVSVLLQYVDPGTAMGLASNLLTGLGGVFANGFLILLTVVFILLELSSFEAKLGVAMGDPEARFPDVTKFTDSVRDYLAIKTLVSLITGALVAGWVWALGVDFPLLWGLLAFLLNFIPNIGSIIAGVPAVLLAFLQFGAGVALAVAAGYIAINTVIGNIIEPRIMGQGLGLSALVVFMSLIFWGWLWGAVGMLLSVPLTMTLKIALEIREDTRWIGVLLGPPVPDEVAPAEK